MLDSETSSEIVHLLTRIELFQDLTLPAIEEIALSMRELAVPAGEMAVIRHHPRWGHEMIKDVPFLRDALPLVLHHHEKYDGSGYPSGLKGEAIPLEARIFAVVDAFDAMNSNRPYRNRLPRKMIVEEFNRCVGTHFDPGVVETLKEILKENPTL